MINRHRVPIRVSGQTFVITSRLIFSHVFSLPSALDVRTKDVIKNPAVSTAEIIRGRLRVMLEAVVLAEALAGALLELILSMSVFICVPV